MIPASVIDRPVRRPPVTHACVLALVTGLAFALCGCGGDDGATAAHSPGVTATAPSPTDDPTATPERTGEPATEAPVIQVVEVRIVGGRVDTARDRVDVQVGAPVRLVVTSDTDDELHVHGVDLEVPLVAGEPAELEFVPEEPGLYDVETHDSHLLLVQLAAR